jgi:serine protease Do
MCNQAMPKLLSILVLAYAIPWLALAAAAAPSPAQALEEQLQKVIEDATPSVVALVVSHRRYPEAPARAPKSPGKLGGYSSPAPERFEIGPAVKLPPVDRLDLSLAENVADNQFGSGVVLDAEKGLILAPYHLIEGATKVFVRSSTGQGSYADIHAADAKSDLAVLKLIRPCRGLASAKLGTARFIASPDGRTPNLKRGSILAALGHPLAAGFADGKPSGSLGILSNVRRRPAQPQVREDVRSNKPLSQYGSLIQTDARIALGSSGAALLNLDGEVIGMSSAVAAVSGSEASGGYAIPFDANYRRIIDVLQAGREVEYGFLGIQLSQLDGPTTVIGGVTPGCPAALADLRTGDTILEVDGQPLKDHDDLLLFVGAALAGSEVTLTVGRTGQKFKRTMILAKIANSLPNIATTPGPGFAGLRVDFSSMELVKLAPQLTGIPLNDPPVGVCVREIEPGSPAEKKLKDAGPGIVGWIITKVGDTPVANPAEFAKAVAGKTSVPLKFVDPVNTGKTILITLP